MRKTLHRSVLVIACVFALSFAAGLLVRYARDGYLESALLTRGDVVRALRQEGFDPRRIESTGYLFQFAAAQVYTYQSDETNSATLHLYIFESEEQSKAAFQSVERAGYGASESAFQAKNILMYAAFHAHRSELTAKLEHAASRMGGGRIRWSGT